MNTTAKTAKRDLRSDVDIRPAQVEDVPSIIRLDELVTGKSKPQYWHNFQAAFAATNPPTRAFLIAELDGRLVGFIAGEIRSFEFGTERTGWILEINVDPQVRVQNVGTRLFDEICRFFADADIDRVHTIIERNNDLMVAFFRSQGMMVGRYIEMERELD
ncbi:MAG: GNAT family N-acetyltransferase [Alphaproteobacteria bacterium]|nr:GNAT family N-acetyltransferase [Alphaproteobacteria bacterium]